MRRTLPYILAFLIPFIVYSPTLTGDFYYDDNVIFLGHQAKVIAENPFKVFDPDSHYLPGVPRSAHVFFLLLLFRLFGPAPLPYHMFNLVMHGATSLLVFVLARRLLAEGHGEGTARTARSAGQAARSTVAPLVGSLAFGLHPVHVENITFVSLGGTDILYAFWGLLSLVSYIWFRDRALEGWKNYVLLVLSVLAFSLALLSKESAIAFVAVYPLTELFMRRRGFLWTAPYAAALAALKLQLVLGTAPAVISQVAGGGEGGSAGPADLVKSLGFFAKSLMVPYPHHVLLKEFGSAAALYGFAALAVALLALAVALRKRLPAYAATWFIAVSGPYLFVPAAKSNIAITAERYIYAPSVAFALLVVWAFSAIASRGEQARRAATAAAAVLLVAYGALGVGYFFSAWQDEEAFWRYVTRSNPEYVTGYTDLATIELRRNNPERAKALLLEGLSKEKGLYYEFSQTAYTLADIYKFEGDQKKAESYYLLSLKYGAYEFSYLDLGYLYLDMKSPARAKWAFQGALRFRPDNAKALIGLSLAHFRLGEKQQARLYALKTLRLARDAQTRAYAEAVLRETKN